MVESAENVAKGLFRQLLCGVMCLHKKGIIHRDLKPNNILVSESSGRLLLKITDFNVAKFVDKYHSFDMFSQTNFEMNTYTGTVAFRAPEMFLMSKYTLIE